MILISELARELRRRREAESRFRVAVARIFEIGESVTWWYGDKLRTATVVDVAGDRVLVRGATGPGHEYWVCAANFVIPACEDWEPDLYLGGDAS